MRDEPERQGDEIRVETVKAATGKPHVCTTADKVSFTCWKIPIQHFQVIFFAFELQKRYEIF